MSWVILSAAQRSEGSFSLCSCFVFSALPFSLSALLSYRPPSASPFPSAPVSLFQSLSAVSHSPMHFLHPPPVGNVIYPSICTIFEFSQFLSGLLTGLRQLKQPILKLFLQFFYS